MCCILKRVALIFISEKYFVDSLLSLQRLTSNKRPFIEEEHHLVRAFFCTLIGSSKPFSGLNFSFQQFHIMCLTIHLPSINQINQRGQKPRHGKNGFAPETSEGQDFALSSVQWNLGQAQTIWSSPSDLLIQLNVFSLRGPGNTCYTACTSHCSGLQ